MLSFLRRLPTCVLSSRVRLAGFCCYDDRAAREGARVLAGFGGSHCRTQHTEPAGVVEVDLRKLRGEDDGIAEVLMCRHKARNALGHVFVSQMRALMSVLSNDDSAVRVLVFRSLVPGVFCAGADLKERALMDDRESDLFVHGLRGLMTQIASLPMPTIAAIDGVALGGGLELALACDLRTAAYSAQMGLIETTRGLLPGAGKTHTLIRTFFPPGGADLEVVLCGTGGSQRLPRTVGITLAKELIFTGKRVGGRGAMEMGLVNRAVDQNETGDAAYSEALSLAREILPQAPIAVRMAKEAMNRGTEVDITSAMAIERMCYAQVIPTRDRREGMAAFIEKRPPRYTGK
ncbi:enoyl-CoA hydratase domain-containing protein 2, mitochondrial isoform X1 [Dunckerocampus dactyliophorus]|uniref:enoyl-CoA hydratase domain-containing protein 2, mitochondrial isoform X1 n=1 Tax=Dunckerocampus dactyliophorus TaxID=161453 RepID=UPI0024062A9E|nr:enoyl-CoA hydratase domain-containing protein 2, mitochondrial isoform X1 [Dunckerocampus dactyliophorus]XP_054646480.1 enoyl-CoA hydratase domain-containing protein 2, mitochondrial isoform X1 [Dunckerocampus dactyliophorus]